MPVEEIQTALLNEHSGSHLPYDSGTSAYLGPRRELEEKKFSSLSAFRTRPCLDFGDTDF